MQYIINQNNIFIIIDYKTEISNSIRYYNENKIKKELYTFHEYKIESLRNGFFYLILLTNNYQKTNTYKFKYYDRKGKKKVKQRFIRINKGIIILFQWLGSITLIEEAIVYIHEYIKILKSKFDIIQEINIYIAGNDYSYNTLNGKPIVKNDLKE